MNKTGKPVRSLRTSIIVSVILIMAVASILYYQIFYYMAKAKVKNDTKSSADNISSHLAGVIIQPMYSYDYSLIRTVCDLYSGIGIVDGIRVYDEKKIAVYESGTIDDTANSIIKEHMIFYRGIYLGRLVMEFSYDSSIKANKKYFLHTFIYVIVYVLMISLLLGIILRRTLQEPVSIFIKNIEGITEGDYQANLDLECFRHSEFHIIGSKFNTMTDHIKKRDDNLKEQARQISESNQRLRILMNTIPDGILLTDKTGSVLDVNDTFCGIYRESKENILNSNIRSIFHESIAERSLLAPVSMPETETRLKNGAPVLLRVTAITMENHKRHLFVITDISYKQEYEKDLQNQKNRLAVTIESMGEGIIASDQDGRVELINAVAQKLTGFSEKEAIGRDIEDIFILYDELTGERLHNYAQKAIKLQETGNIKGPRILMSKAGISRAVSGTIAPIRDTGGCIIGSIIVFRDITELKRIQEENTQAAKLRSLGVLAGGISHDFSNILTIILANLSLLRLKTDNKPEVTRFFDLIEGACGKAENLTKELLSFSRGGELIKKESDILSLFEKTAGLINHRGDIEINMKALQDIPRIKLDVQQMERVVQNLLINAVYAMPGKKRIDIAFDRYCSTPEDALILKPGSYVKVSIRDYGTGIDKKDIPRIFDPYYTTKSKGSGLGLAVVFSVIRKHEGYIFVSSEVSRGTEFTIYLPE